MLDIKDFIKGWEVAFIFIEGSSYEGKSVQSVLLSILKKNDALGYSIRADSEGGDHKKKRHSARFFELADSPIELIFVDSSDKAQLIIDEVKALKLPIFCTVKEVSYLNMNVD